MKCAACRSRITFILYEKVFQLTTIEDKIPQAIKIAFFHPVSGKQHMCCNFKCFDAYITMLSNTYEEKNNTELGININDDINTMMKKLNININNSNINDTDMNDIYMDDIEYPDIEYPDSS